MLGIGARIKELRNALNISQEDLAARLNVSRGNVGDWERGRAKPGAEALVALSRCFDVSVDWIVSGREFHSPNIRRLSEALATEEILPDDIVLLAKLKQLPEKERWKVEGYIDALINGSPERQTRPKEKSSRSMNGEEAAASEGA